MNMFRGWRSNSDLSGNSGNNNNSNNNNNDGNNNNNNNNNNSNNNRNARSNNNANNGNNNNNNGNNDDNNDDISSIWDDTATNNDGNNNNNNNNNNNGNNGNNNGNNNNNNQNTQTFDQWVDTLDFGIDVPKEVADKLATGDLTGLPDLMSSTAKAAYKRALQDTSKLIDKRVKDAVTEAVNTANSSRKIDNVVTRMNETLEFTADTLIAPVAKTVLGRALKKGQNEDQAIETVRKYFQQTADKAASALGNKGGNNRNQRLPGNGAFNNNRDDDVDFLELLSGREPE